METRANYAIVGLFTVLVMLAAFGFVYWMTQFGGAGEPARLVVRIPGSANGLSIGSPVRFNGIAIGTVRGLAIDRTSPNFVIAQTDVRADAPIYSDTRAALEIQGLTGSAYIELQGGTPSNENILLKAMSENATAVIEADPSGVTNLLATADEILNRANRVIGQVEGFVKDARDPLTATLKNTEVFTGALRDNADGIDDFLQSVAALSETVKSLSGRIETALAAAEDLIKAVDPVKVDNILANVSKVTDDAAAASADIPKTLASLREAASNVQKLTDDAGKTFEQVNKVVAGIDPEKITLTLDNVAVASGDARQALADVKSVASTFQGREQDIDQIITDVKQMSNNLNAASTRVDGVLAKIDGFLGEGDASSLLADAEATLKSIKDAADSLTTRIGPIADNLQQFSGSGLKDVQALVNDARRSINRIEGSISAIEQNPQRLIFGGETVKQYDGRTRR
ncbi:phospholipid/cholesterol/gamma-HCH transport system substrate-binding protein [Hoeflea marina]|uniref:Phospholipid/cholesterol/gamma-HCH transport system substrate-binding protein n=1 Tax=Hoeflea marina TaxID=274592 RepID=A0A317PVX6_9HYPH|nr:MlaD family protein [Hoeflea marina]PWW04436.1 phospholipid/cholesterol/gamma-HCH transport system substrate-binding protein [Hoeflea marina]